MTPDDPEGPGLLGHLHRLLQVALVALAGYVAIAGDWVLLANAVLVLAVTALPDLLRWRSDHELDPRLALWITAAGLIHAVGFLGPYGTPNGLLAWYDRFAHAVSAGFVAGVGYALVDGLDRGSRLVRFPAEFRFAFTVAFILACGVAWEVAEFGAGAITATLTGTEILVQYGVEDVVGDLAFNTLAAAAVALWGTGYFDGVAAAVAGRLSVRNRS